MAPHPPHSTAAVLSGNPTPSGGYAQPPRLTKRAWAWMLGCSVALSMMVLAAITWLLPPTKIQIGLPGGVGPQLTVQTPGGFEKEKILLVMGTDVNYENKDRNNTHGARTDTMMLVRISPGQKSVSLVSIPRDSKVYLADNHGVDKINAAHSIGGPELAVKTVQEAFGIPVDHYMVINFRGVRDLVDALGGVSVFIEKPLRYTDNTAKLHINLQPGLQQLDGKTMEGYLRFRHDAMADIGRIRRQQQFVTAVAEKIKSPWIIAKIPSLVSLGTQYLQTDMTPDDLFRLVMLLKDIKLNAMKVSTLPGHASGGPVSYWIIDPQPAQAVLDKLILNSSTSPFATPQQPIKVGVMYSHSSANRLPGVVANLSQQGFTVVCKALQGGRSTVLHPSTIIEHTNQMDAGLNERLRTVDASLPTARLIFSPMGSTYEENACSSGEDVTLVLGDIMPPSADTTTNATTTSANP
jgi:polyisoprenyl-teichoic acid--peptidoglycan teichoic acid transferase